MKAITILISIVSMIGLAGCAEMPVRGSFIDVSGVERVTEKQCLVGIITPNECRTVAHKKGGGDQYIQTADEITESAGFLQNAGTSAVHGAVGAELFDDKGNSTSQIQNNQQRQRQNQTNSGMQGWSGD